MRDDMSLKLICSYAELSLADTVLEIGPGQGSLTELLVKKVKSVVAVELDDKLAALLPNLVNADNLTVIHKNILEYDLTQLPPAYKVVANIPYYLTSRLIRVLSETANPPQLIVLLVQKEVAERLAAAPGKMSVLAVTAQFYWQAELGEVLSRDKFSPPPKVDSQIIVLKKRNLPLFNVETEKFFRLVKLGFSARRKTLNNTLANGLRIGKAKITAVIEDLKLDANIRPQMLSMDNWFALYELVLAENLL